ncbi:MAG: hypothetical protein AAGN15_15980 [Cyanobacteria bacterium J06581_3]
MGLKIYAGRTLCLPIPSRQSPHLFIALTGSFSYQDSSIVLVNLTKLGSGRSKDTTAILQPGDHPFIRVATVVNYQDAFIATAANMLQLVTTGKANFMDDCESELLDRIQTGALHSPFIDPEIKDMVSDYLN